MYCMGAVNMKNFNLFVFLSVALLGCHTSNTIAEIDAGSDVDVDSDSDADSDSGIAARRSRGLGRRRPPRRRRPPNSGRRTAMMQPEAAGPKPAYRPT